MKSFKKFSLLLALGLMMSMHLSANAADLTISDAAGFVEFANRVNAGDSFAGSTVTLASNLDMESTTWVPVGTKEHPFAGTFNGNGKTISNLTTHYQGTFNAGTPYVGLFGYNKGTIKDLTVEAAVPTGEGWDAGIGHWVDSCPNFSGILVGYNEGNISGCTTQGYLNVENQSSYSANGGICGYNKGTISNCTNEVNVQAVNTTVYYKLPTRADCYSGGIAGLNEGTVTGCTNVYASLIRATCDYGSAAGGGIVGDNRKGGIISNCNGSGEIYVWTKTAISMAYAYAGGVVGSNGGTVTSSYANQARVKGVVEGTDDYRFCYADFGGVCGYNYGTIDGCKSNTTEFSGGVKNNLHHSYKAYGGGIVGYNKGTVSNVESSSKYVVLTHNSVAVSPDYLGGICGYNEGGIISRAVSSTTISSYADLNGRERYLGGIAGVNDGGFICLSGSKSTLVGSVDGGITAGGIAGKNSGAIENCYNSGSTVKGYTAAGLAGKNTGSIVDCYSRASLNVNSKYKDGITYNNEGYVQDCYSVGSTTVIGGTYVSNATNLKKPETFKNWDFNVFWEISPTVNSGYPTIKAVLGEHEFFGEGNGTVASPYLITTQAELNRIRYQPDKHYRLMNDIEMTGNWSPIGNCAANAFKGTFEGNGHTISNLNLNGNGNEYNGLFGYIDGAGIYNLTIKNATYTISEAKGRGVYAGGIVGFARNNATVENCVFNGTITSTSPVATVGGIAGDFEGTIKGCHTLGTVSVNAAGEYVYSTLGGIAGKAEGTVSGCNSKMALNARENDASGYPMETSGGIVGRMKGKIVDSCFEGTVNVTDKQTVYHGGITGSVEGDVKSSYTDYAMIYENNINGAIAGQVMQGDVSSSYFNNGQSWDAYGNGTNAFSIDELRNNATEKKYIWVTASDDNDPEPLHVTVEWIIEDGFTKCKLTPNTSDATIYYTTNGLTPSTSSTRYDGPFLANLFDKVSYLVVSGTAQSEVMGFVSAPQSKYLAQIASVPTNQNDEVVTNENIASCTTVNIELLTEEDSVGTQVFFVVLDNNNKIVYANTAIKSLIKGKNKLSFTDMSIPKEGAKIQIYVWDDELKLIPRSEIIKL